MLNLPIEIESLILSFLPFADLVTCRLVSRAFKRRAERFLAVIKRVDFIHSINIHWADINIDILFREIGPKLLIRVGRDPAPMLKFLSQLCPRIIMIEAGDHRVQLESILPWAEQLVFFSFDVLKTDAKEIRLCQHFPNLRTFFAHSSLLNFRTEFATIYNRTRPDQLIEYIMWPQDALPFRSHHQLDSIKGVRFSGDDDKMLLVNFPRYVVESLESLVLNCQSRRVPSSLARRLPALRSFNLTNPRIDLNHLVTALAASSRLCILRLSGGTGPTHTALPALLSQHRRLKQFKLYEAHVPFPQGDQCWPGFSTIRVMSRTFAFPVNLNVQIFVLTCNNDISLSGVASTSMTDLLLHFQSANNLTFEFPNLKRIQLWLTFQEDCLLQLIASLRHSIHLEHLTICIRSPSQPTNFSSRVSSGFWDLLNSLKPTIRVFNIFLSRKNVDQWIFESNAAAEENFFDHASFPHFLELEWEIPSWPVTIMFPEKDSCSEKTFRLHLWSDSESIEPFTSTTRNVSSGRFKLRRQMHNDCIGDFLRNFPPPVHNCSYSLNKRSKLHIVEWIPESHLIAFCDTVDGEWECQTVFWPFRVEYLSHFLRAQLTDYRSGYRSSRDGNFHLEINLPGSLRDAIDSDILALGKLLSESRILVAWKFCDSQQTGQLNTDECPDDPKPM